MRPWWHLRPRDDDGTGIVDGDPHPAGWVLVPTAFDALGQPCGWIWCAPEAAAQWDATRWRSTPPI